MSVASSVVPNRVPAWRPYLKAAVPLAGLAVAAAAMTPNLAPLAEASVAIKLHLAAAVGALGLGAALMASRKGARFHRKAGWVWVALMATVVVSSLFIAELNHGQWSWIHLFSGFTAVMLPLGVLAAKRHEVSKHRGVMMGTFFGGLIVAGLFTFVPGRLLYGVFFQ